MEQDTLPLSPSYFRCLPTFSKRMPVFLRFIAMVLVFSVPQLWASEEEEEEKPDLRQVIPLVDAWLDAQRDYEAIPGLVVGIMHDQELVWSNGYGFADLKQKIPCTPDTIFSICSISKLFTAVAIMQLWEQGKLRLDDEVKTLLPWMDLEQVHVDSVPITVRGLLTHSAGLPRESDFPYWRGDFPFPTSKEFRARLSEQQTLYPASKYWQYSNLGLSLLGEIIAEVSRQPYDDYVKEQILVPLELNDTRTFLPTDLHPEQLASGYSARQRSGDRNRVAFFETKGITAAAGFTSSVNDLAKFAAWQFRVLQGQEELLKPSTLKEMQRVHWLDPDFKNSWGLGFVVNQLDGDLQVSHGGSCPGYRTQISIIPKKKIAVVLMANANGINPAKYTSAIHQILTKAKPVKDEEAPAFTAADYTGIYDVTPWGGEVFVGPWQNELVSVGFPTDKPQEFTRLKHIEGDLFKRIRDDDELGEAFRFERDESGRVLRFWRHSNNYDKIR